ncbi:DEAD/DEAH box helicase [Thermobifida fusca]|uniref:DEAD/DEAH box helicase n=1 Tax=Thermobifida fusca TaxID=2021 RepID=UPI000CEF5944|nr:DEAD/DEAH box helicase [Thermobifida fusca]PPS92094.1 DEAD/DEAH box helicase [Thermobifida fusca]
MTRPSPPSGSNTTAPDAFSLLHRDVQRWVWEQRWTSLRPIQEQAIQPIISGNVDVLLAAATAGGKTEAVFLPVCSVLARDADHGEATGIQAVCLSPLKALINDQHARLTALCARIKVPVTAWHGDIGVTQKDRLRGDPAGILLITPESLEAMFVRRGSTVSQLFRDLRYIVVDELHSFLGTARGAQLRSLMNRLEHAAGRRVSRIGMSATLADLRAAAEFLRPGHGEQVVVVEDQHGGKELLLQLRGYVADMRSDPGTSMSPDALAHLYQVVRTGHNMVFVNSRGAVESCVSALSALARQERLPNPFFPHHGSLSAELRTHAEQRLKNRSAPATVVCTSTLELGIDVGWVDTVVQLGVPPSVAGLRQRLGRSGRGGAAAKLYLYITEQAHPDMPVDRLRLDLVQTVAMVELLLSRWYEPPNLDTPHLSTLVQQILSVLAQHGGAHALRLYRELCATGAFPGVDEHTFASLLRSLGEHQLISQERSGLLLPGKIGEALLNHYAFYSAFDVAEEYAIATVDGDMGTMPLSPSVDAGALLAFAGRTWQVVEVKPDERRILVTPARGSAVPPGFMGSAAPVHDRIRQRMREVYLDTEVPRYLDEAAAILLDEGRSAFRAMGLADTDVYEYNGDTLLFPWRGDRTAETLRHLFQWAGMKAVHVGAFLAVPGTPADSVRATAAHLVAADLPDPVELARRVADQRRHKYDRYLGEELLSRSYAAHALDLDGALEFLSRVAADH